MRVFIGIIIILLILFFIIAYPAIWQNRKEKKIEKARLNLDNNISWLLTFLKDNGFVKQQLTLNIPQNETAQIRSIIKELFFVPDPNVIQIVESDDIEENHLTMHAVCERLPKDHYFMIEVKYQFNKIAGYVPENINMFEMKHGNSEHIHIWSFESKQNHDDDITELNNYFDRFVHTE